MKNTVAEREIKDPSYLEEENRRLTNENENLKREISELKQLNYSLEKGVIRKFDKLEQHLTKSDKNETSSPIPQQKRSLPAEEYNKSFLTSKKNI
ncbi:hypothetical protein AOXY_G5306 [Acipenser oxyrinchus oxyrinchus]|uniref:Uncharacterized protein n=1 Tax=Acipenser oxyrinchus oxyrinchus TaxID=40147 RepID=A0AAD8GE75_ACIOX|nr:hypothetical protein AOXY_G5306 [Acipenser oxyrinchus oxyrinchus]